MRYFPLAGVQDVILFLFPTLVLIVLLYVAFARAHFRRKDSDGKEQRIIHTYGGEIEERDAAFPLFLFLIILGFVLWTIFYTIGNGYLEVKI
jgi:hypothetical protein